MLLPVASVALAYVLFVALTGEQVRRAQTVHRSRIPALLVTADILALAALVWLTGSPAVATRLLIGALLVVQLAVFYFGRALGIYAAAISGAGVRGRRARACHRRHQAPRRSCATSRSRSVCSPSCRAVLISAYGSFRERMNRLRLFCKLVEDGDLHPTLDLGVDKRPDDLTLLAQSFDAMRARLGEQIGTDPLTGCLNRRALETRLRAELRQAKRRANTLAILAIDLDHFKEINDTHGHPFGDLVLTDLAAIMRTTARDTDAVARLGGDEFIVVLPDTGLGGRADLRRADAPPGGRAHVRVGDRVDAPDDLGRRRARTRHGRDVARDAAPGSGPVALQGEERGSQPCLRLRPRRP